MAILISRYGGKFSVTHYVSQSANLMIREIGIVLFLASVGLDAGRLLSIRYSVAVACIGWA